MSEQDDAAEFAQFQAWKAEREAAAAKQEGNQAIQQQIKGARSEAELTDLLESHRRAGTLPGVEGDPVRAGGNGKPILDWEIKACRSAEELDAYLSERVGASDAHELGVAHRFD